MRLTNLLKKMAAVEPDGYPFLSIYINAEPDETGRDSYRISLKKELSEQAAKYADNEDEATRMQSAMERIETYLDEIEAQAKGVAIFIGLGDSGPFEAVQLDVPFDETRVFNLDRPHIFPLAKTIAEHPKYAVLWADTNKADIYVFGGENRIRTDNDADAHVENIQNDVTNRTQVGGWSQNRYQRRAENFHLQHAKEVVAELEQVMRDRNIDQLVLCGDETTIMPILRPQLPKALDEKVIGTLNISQYDSQEEIHEKTLEVLSIERATRQQQQVERVFDAARASAGLGTLGLEDTLRALSNGQVEELIISSDFGSIQYKKNEVDNILLEYAPGDDNSTVDTLPITHIPAEVADELIKRALNSDAKITFIGDASLLVKAGGVGAVLRFNMNATANG